MDLRLALKERPADQQAVVTELIASVTVSGSGGTGFLDTLQPADTPIALGTSPHSSSHQVSIGVALDARQVESVERLRMGGDLALIVDLRGRVQVQGESALVSDRHEHRVQQGAWVRVLEQMEYGRMILLEVPVPNVESAPLLVEPVRHLEKAQQAMLRGEWREAVGCCRDVLEALADVLLDARVQDPEVNALFEGTRFMNKEARLRTLRRALLVLCHPARHADEVAKDFEWEPRDARAVVAAVAALVSRYGPPNQ